MNNYCVYKHTCPDGKVYVGITCQNPLRRWANGKGYSHNRHFTNAILRFGWDNIKHEILFSGLCADEAYEKEIELIAKHKSNNPKYGYNLSSGGEQSSNGRKLSVEQRSQMSQSRMGGNNPHSVRVLCVETGEIFESIREAVDAYGVPYSGICACCRGKRKTSGKKHWRWA